MDKKFIYRIDYLTQSFPVDFLEDVAGIVECHFGQRMDLQRGARFYASTWAFGEADAFIFHSRPDEPLDTVGKAHATMEIKGSALSMLDPDDLYDFFRELCTLDSSRIPDVAHVLKTTRIDCAVDDFSHVIEPDRLWEDYAVQGKTYGPRPDQHIRGLGGHGSTYFGKRGRLGGGVQLCVYDKSFQSLGVIDSVRWEARFYKQKAESAWDSLQSCLDPRELAAGVSRLVGGVIDVFDESSASCGRHLSRRSRAPWFQEFREVLGSFRVALPPRDPPSSMEAVRRWLQRVAGPRLAAVKMDCADAGEWDRYLGGVLVSGERRMRPSLRRLIRSPAVVDAFSEALPF
jgi:hypothetical protein